MQFENGSYFHLLPSANDLQHSDLPGKAVSAPFINGTLMNAKVCILFLNVDRKKSSSLSLLNHVDPALVLDPNVPALPFVKEVLSSKRLQAPDPAVTGVTSTDIYNIQDPKWWFTSSVIDAYMGMLCSSVEGVHSTAAGWFNQHCFENSNLKQRTPLHKLESKIRWFSKEYIIIPTNSSDCHWMMFMIDIRPKVIHVCDSLGDNVFEAVRQLLCYLGLEYFILYKQKMNYNSWKIVHFADQECFVKQSDKNNCGPYVCLMAKALLCQRKFTFDKSKARHTIACELKSGKLVL